MWVRFLPGGIEDSDGESNAGAMSRQLSRPRGGAQTKLRDGTALVEGDSCREEELAGRLIADWMHFVPAVNRLTQNLAVFGGNERGG